MIDRLPSGADELVVVGDPALTRLFPPAHPSDDALEAEWQAMMASQKPLRPGGRQGAEGDAPGGGAAPGDPDARQVVGVGDGGHGAAP